MKRIFCFWPMFLLAFNSFIVILCAEEYRELKDSEKKLYKSDVTYTEIADDPDRFALKKDASKKVLKLINKGFISKLPPPYEKNLPQTFSMLKLENPRKELPIVFNSSNTRIRKEISLLEADQLFTIYVTVNLKNCKDEQPAKPGATATPKFTKAYYLMIDDIEVQSSAKASGNKKDVNDKEKAVQTVDGQEYEYMKYRYIDMQPKKYLGKNIRFELSFKDISNTIPPQMMKYAEISPDEYFLVIPYSTFLLPIVVKRDNDVCINALAEIDAGANLSLCGTVKCVGDPSDKSTKPMYYVLLANVADLTSSEKATEDIAKEDSVKEDTPKKPEDSAKKDTPKE